MTRPRPAPNSRYRTQPLPPRLHPALWSCTGFALAQCARAGDTLFASLLEPLGLTPPLFATLLLLEANGPLRQARVGEALGIDKATVVRLIDALEALGLAARRSDPDDARSVLVHLDDRARGVLDDARRIESEASEQLTAPLDARERAMFHALLQKVARGLGLAGAERTGS
jgi:DNA-binding MarR family transcriptional regulator